MRLIDADVLEPHEQLEPMGNGKYEYVEVVYKDDIDDVPTIDAVEVVRCKDCKWAKKAILDEYCVKCTMMHTFSAKHGYCHHGERREP